MKVQIENGWLVHMGAGIAAHADTLEEAEQLERDAVKMKNVFEGLGYKFN